MKTKIELAIASLSNSHFLLLLTALSDQIDFSCGMCMIQVSLQDMLHLLVRNCLSILRYHHYSL